MTRFITLTAVLGGLLFATTVNAQYGCVTTYRPMTAAPQVAQAQPRTGYRAFSYEPTVQAPVQTFAPAPMYRGYATGGGRAMAGWNQAGWKTR